MVAGPAVQQLSRFDPRTDLFVMHGSGRVGRGHGTQYLATRRADGSAVIRGQLSDHVALADVTPHPCTPSEACTTVFTENSHARLNCLKSVPEPAGAEFYREHLERHKIGLGIGLGRCDSSA